MQGAGKRLPVPPQSDPAKRAIIYCRQSKDSEDGIDRQIEKCQKLIAERGWELVHAAFCDNDVSATKRRKRPAYEQAMAMVRGKQCDVLVVAHMDRLYRRAAELETIIPLVEQTGVLVVSTDGAYDLSTANGRMVARMLCAASQGEVETKARRNRDANVQAAQNGERNKSGCRPFGYCADRITPMDAGVSLAAVQGTAATPSPVLDGPGWGSDEPWQEVTVRVPETVYDTDGRVTSTQSEADAIRDAIASVLRGGSVAGVGRKWHALGLRPPLAPFGPLPGGNPWNHHTVKRILTNPHIAGWRSYRNGEIIAAGNWPALIGTSDWEAAQVILSNPSPNPSRGMLSLLGGIAECRCGGKVKHAPRRSYGMYRCSGYEPEGPARVGPHVAVKAGLIDRYVTDVLIETMELPDAADLFADDADEIDIPALKERLVILEKALAKLSMQNSMDLIPDSVFAVNAAEISAEQERIKVQIAEASQVNAAAVLVASADVRATWDGMSIPERRTVIRSVMRVTLKPPGCGCRKPDLDQLVRITWKVPRSPSTEPREPPRGSSLRCPFPFRCQPRPGLGDYRGQLVPLPLGERRAGRCHLPDEPPVPVVVQGAAG
jgi:site-specific DNA recombinase